MYSEDSHPHPYRPLDREGHLHSTIPLSTHVGSIMWPAKRHTAAAGGHLSSYSYPTTEAPILILAYCQGDTVYFYPTSNDSAADGCSSSIRVLSMEEMREQSGAGGSHLSFRSEGFLPQDTKINSKYRTVISPYGDKSELSEGDKEEGNDEDEDSSSMTPKTKKAPKRSKGNGATVVIKKEVNRSDESSEDDNDENRKKKRGKNSTDKSSKRELNKKDTVKIKEENGNDIDEDSKDKYRKRSVRDCDIISFRWAPPAPSTCVPSLQCTLSSHVSTDDAKDSSLKKNNNNNNNSNSNSNNNNDNNSSNSNNQTNYRYNSRDSKYHMCAWLTSGNTVEIAEVAIDIPFLLSKSRYDEYSNDNISKINDNSDNDNNNNDIIKPILGRKRLLICPSVHITIPSHSNSSGISHSSSEVVGSKRDRNKEKNLKKLSSSPTELTQRHTFVYSVYFIHWLDYKDLLLVTSVGIAIVDVLVKITTPESDECRHGLQLSAAHPQQPVICTLEPSDFCVLFERSHLSGRNPLIGWWTFLPPPEVCTVWTVGDVNKSNKPNVKTKGATKGQRINNNGNNNRNDNNSVAEGSPIPLSVYGNDVNSENSNSSSVVVVGDRHLLILHDNFEPTTAADPQLISPSPMNTSCCTRYAFAVAGSSLLMSSLKTSHVSSLGDGDKNQRLLPRQGVIKTFVLCTQCRSNHHSEHSVIPCGVKSWRAQLAGTSMTHQSGADVHNMCSNLSLMVPIDTNSVSSQCLQTYGSFIPTIIHLSPVILQAINNNTGSSVPLNTSTVNESSLQNSAITHEILTLDLLVCGPLSITNLIRQQLLLSPFTNIHNCGASQPNLSDLSGIYGSIKMTSSKLVVSWNNCDQDLSDVTTNTSNMSVHNNHIPEDKGFTWRKLPTHQPIVGTHKYDNKKTLRTESEETIHPYRQDPYVHQIIRLPSLSSLSVTFILLGSQILSYVTTHYFSKTTIQEGQVSSCNGSESKPNMTMPKGKLEKDSNESGVEKTPTVNVDHIVVNVTSGIIFEATDGGLPMGLHMAGAKLLSSRDQTNRGTKDASQHVTQLSSASTSHIEGAVGFMEGLELFTGPERAGKLPLFSVLSHQTIVECPPPSREANFYTPNSLSRFSPVHNIISFSLHPSGLFGGIIVGSVGLVNNIMSHAIVVPLEAFERNSNVSFVAMTVQNNSVLERTDSNREICRYPLSSVERTGRLALLSEILYGHLVIHTGVTHQVKERTLSSTNTVSFLTLGCNLNSQTLSQASQNVTSVENGHLSLIDPGAAVDSDEFPVSSKVREALRQLIISAQLELTTVGAASYQEAIDCNSFVERGNCLNRQDVCISHFCHEGQNIAIPRELSVDIPYELAALRRHLSNWDVLMTLGIVNGIWLNNLMISGERCTKEGCNKDNRRMNSRSVLNLLPPAGSLEAKEMFLNYLYRRIWILLSRYLLGDSDGAKNHYGYTYYVRRGNNSNTATGSPQWDSLLLEIIAIVNSIEETEITLASHSVTDRQIDAKRAVIMMLELRNAENKMELYETSQQGGVNRHSIQSIYNTLRNQIYSNNSGGNTANEQGIPSNSSYGGSLCPVEGALLWSDFEIDDLMNSPSRTMCRTNKYRHDDGGISIALLFPMNRIKNGGSDSHSLPYKAINKSSGLYNIILITKRDVFIELWLGYAITYLFFEGKKEQNDSIVNASNNVPGKVTLYQRMSALVFLIAYIDDVKRKLEPKADTVANDTDEVKNGQNGSIAEHIDCTLCWSSHSFIESLDKFITMVSKRLHLPITTHQTEETDKDRSTLTHGSTVRKTVVVEGRHNYIHRGSSCIARAQYSFIPQRLISDNYNRTSLVFGCPHFDMFGHIMITSDHSRETSVCDHGSANPSSTFTTTVSSSSNSNGEVFALESVSVISPNLWEIKWSVLI